MTKSEQHRPLKTEPKKIIRSCKHVYTPAERSALGDELARQVCEIRAIESELDGIKATYKAKTASAEAIVNQHSTALSTGFEFRNTPCVVFFDAKARKRIVFREQSLRDTIAKYPELRDGFPEEVDLAIAEAIEDMSPADFQREFPIVEEVEAISKEAKAQADDTQRQINRQVAQEAEDLTPTDRDGDRISQPLKDAVKQIRGGINQPKKAKKGGGK